jgi:hypothetical protein
VALEAVFLLGQRLSGSFIHCRMRRGQGGQGEKQGSGEYSGQLGFHFHFPRCMDGSVGGTQQNDSVQAVKLGFDTDEAPREFGQFT